MPSSRRRICGLSFLLDSLWLKHPRCPSLLSALRRSVCTPCHIRCFRAQRSNCSDYTRGQSPETGSLSGHLAVWEPLPSVSHWVLLCRFWFYQSSLPRRRRMSEDSRFKQRLQLRRSWCPWPRTYEGRPCWRRVAYTTAYGSRLSSMPSWDRSANPATFGVPGRSYCISCEHTSQFLPPGNVAELGCSPLLWGSLEQIDSVLESCCAEASAPRAWPFRWVSKASSHSESFWGLHSPELHWHSFVRGSGTSALNT